MYYRHLSLAILTFVLIASCGGDKKTSTRNMPLNDQVRVQVVYDATDIAFNFTWKSQGKTYPTGKANVGQKYPGQHHDMLMFSGTKFDRAPSDERMQEDRVSFMIADYVDGPQLVNKLSCAASCHENMDDHRLLSPANLDHWHWRGGRSGPMGYAEDAAVSEVGRIRDGAGTPPSKFMRSGGDRLREDQAALAGTGHQALTLGLPRFVFNKGKVMSSTYTVPSFFLTNEAGTILTNQLTQIPLVRSVAENRTLLVGYQNLIFDATDKVNALDVGYLVYVATGSLAHMPSHLRDASTPDFQTWATYSAAQSGVAAGNTAAANAKLSAILLEWENSGRKAMVTRSIGFIYPSDQHDVRSEKSYNSDRNEWTVTLFRKLSTGSQLDADLAGIRTGRQYSFSFAMHDVGGGSESHNISMPLTLSNLSSSDLVAKEVSNVKTATWDRIGFYDTFYVKAEYVNEWKWTRGWLMSSSHGGSTSIVNSTCATCHQNKLTTQAVL